MLGYNSLTVVGNLGTEPEMRYMPNGTAVTSFRLAVTRRYKKADELQEDTQWFSCYVYGQLAEICAQHLGKGRRVLVEGRVALNQWEGTSGEQRSRMEINASKVLFLSSGGAHGSGPGPVDDGADVVEMPGEESTLPEPAAAGSLPAMASAGKGVSGSKRGSGNDLPDF